VPIFDVLRKKHFVLYYYILVGFILESFEESSKFSFALVFISSAFIYRMKKYPSGKKKKKKPLRCDCMLLTSGQKLKRVLRSTVICNGANRQENKNQWGKTEDFVFSTL